ncbi:alpha/beta fold hydrolase [Novosphingobium kaempferiae]|uniref:alpha/beta fold hydrolase n=1 Tax=Novosphingobium kaempferiae TaxID=2896849 RepID=UPI001E2FBA6D|nr:alpha/beta fold hydrolase [Novosphingobium kaempferiae]
MAAPLVRRAYCNGPYGQVHYRIARPAEPAVLPPLLCLHQTPKSGIDYEPIMPLLAAQGRVVLAPDTPGYGGSDAPLAPIGIRDFGHVMAGFLETMRADGVIGEGPIDVMGYHTGSVTATELAVTRPRLIRRLVLVSLAAYEAEERARRLASIDRFPVPRPDASHVAQLWNLMETMHDARVDLGWKHASLAEHLRPGDRLPWGFRAVYEYDFIGALEKLRQPTLLLCPEDDLWEVTHREAHRIADLTLVELPGAAHGFLKVDAEALSARIDMFLKDC